MKILFITQFLPFPNNTGGKVKTWEILKALSLKHEIFLVCFIDKKEDQLGEKEVKKYCSGVKTFVQPIITQAHQNLKKLIIESFFSELPYRAYKHSSPKMKAFLSKISGELDFDAYYFDHDVMLQYRPCLKDTSKKLVYFDEHNISSQAAWERMLIERSFFLKVAFLTEVLKWYFYEKKYFSKTNYVFAISQTDVKRLVKRGVSEEKIKVLPIAKQANSVFSFKKKKTLLFVGLLSWRPNSDGFWWFYHNVFPQIKKQNPDVIFEVVGAYPGEKMIRKGELDRNLSILGYVNDLASCYQRASVFVVPIRIGSGIRIKILEALSRGIPVVSTSKGAEGIIIKKGQDLLVADKPEDFAKAVNQVLNSPQLANKLSRNGLVFVKKNYSLKKTLLAFKAKCL